MHALITYPGGDWQAQVDCWGDNGVGQLGNGTIGGPDCVLFGVGSCYDSPQAVTGVIDAKAMTSDGYGAAFCALLTTDRVDCWGDNGVGQLGNGTIGGPDCVLFGVGSCYDSPQAVTRVINAKSMVNYHIYGGGYCALLTTGGIDCWGYNGDGELGNGTTVSSITPVPVLAPS